MLKLTCTLILLIALTGCSQPTQNIVSIQYTTCKSDRDVGVKLINGIYECVEGKSQVVKRKFVSSKTAPKTIKTSGCETTITQHYYSKSGGLIKTCHGKILEIGQKTRIKVVRE